MLLGWGFDMSFRRGPTADKGGAMKYRYRLHRLTDAMTPLGAGRPLLGRNASEAVAQATDLWEETASASALGCCIVDTEDGSVLWQRERTAVRPA